ncbi:MAG: SDR family NAD(P)-dependent oxidoreductase [Pseudonocardiaceae bacterium]
MVLQDKVVIVTGSSRGIGRAVALAFAARGAKTLVNSSTDVAGGQDVMTAIASDGGTAHYVQADVSDPDQVELMFDEAETALGPVDILVNNAGGLPQGASLAKNTKEHWLHMLNVNLLSTVVCSMRAAIMMADRGGSIINTSAALSGETVAWNLTRDFDANTLEGIIAYSAAKVAVNDFTKTLAKRLAPAVRVNAVAPGFVTTSHATSYMDRVDEDVKQSWLGHIPLRRAIDPAEIACSYIHLAESAYLTGTILIADAGITLGQG